MKLSSMGQRVALGAMLLLGALAATRAAESYHLLKKYAFPSAKGFRKEYYHHITIDSAARRVYLSHGTEIIVLDADSGSVLGTIEHLQRTHGVAIAAEFGRGFITDGEA